jgi:K+ transporter
MVIGDGILTLAISVLSEVSGVKRASSSLNDRTEVLFTDLGHFAYQSIQVMEGIM